MCSIHRLGAYAFIAFLAACSGDAEKPAPKGDGGTAPPAGWRAAVGTAGAFVQTFDDVRWSSRKIADVAFYGVTCVSNRDGWAVGAHGTIAQTSDGGGTWALQTSGVEVDLRAVRFASKSIGFAVGDAGTLLSTTDGGASWGAKDVGLTTTLRGVAMSDAGWLSFVVGDGGTFLRTRNGGVDWAKTPITGAAGLRAIATDASAHLVVTVDDAGRVFTSTDLGLAFHEEAQAPVGLDAVAVAWDGSAAIVVGHGGLAMVREASGSWRSLTTGTSRDLHAALITDHGNRWYLAGDGGTLLASTDHGATWQSVPLATTETLYGLEDL